eukprot:TRINITY_DN4145_c0_g1_i4.p1 TRINITY_DN4145_c0_g1~~TRINITY_DN4145_c0_g1_i4.p1  ORF type:complete len:1436 (-),score=334.66 TRINITY_DN4145_c0_g1_i4:290-4597(-)
MSDTEDNMGEQPLAPKQDKKDKRKSKRSRVLSLGRRKSRSISSGSGDGIPTSPLINSGAIGIDTNTTNTNTNTPASPRNVSIDLPEASSDSPSTAHKRKNSKKSPSRKSSFSSDTASPTTVANGTGSPKVRKDSAKDTPPVRLSKRKSSKKLSRKKPKGSTEDKKTETGSEQHPLVLSGEMALGYAQFTAGDGYDDVGADIAAREGQAPSSPQSPEARTTPTLPRTSLPKASTTSGVDIEDFYTTLTLSEQQQQDPDAAKASKLKKKKASKSPEKPEPQSEPVNYYMTFEQPLRPEFESSADNNETSNSGNNENNDRKKGSKQKRPNHTVDELMPPTLYTELDKNDNPLYTVVDTKALRTPKKKTPEPEEAGPVIDNSYMTLPITSPQANSGTPKSGKRSKKQGIHEQPPDASVGDTSAYVEVKLAPKPALSKIASPKSEKKKKFDAPKVTDVVVNPAQSDLEKLISRATPETLKQLLIERLNATGKQPTTDLSFLTSALRFEETARAARQSKSGEKLMELRNWNNEMRQILTYGPTAIGSQETSKVASLGFDFVRCAETYAKIIINELSLAWEHKTIKPVNVGGIAGGEKYVVHGIMFKFCLDQLLISGDHSVWMYGGRERNDENAMKTGGLELQGLSNWFSQLIPGLCFPLMAMIDYKGFRIIATSLLPLTKTSLRYGSADGGRTVLAQDPTLNKIMDDAAAGMNLKKHNVGFKRVPISGPGDIEGHLGTDGNYYLLDFARTFPPAAPEFDDNGLPKEPRAVFFRMLRPELVKTNKVPLSSDAFTGWGNYDENRKQSQQEVQEATNRIKTECIPALVGELQSIDIATVSDNYFESMRGGNAKTMHKLLEMTNLTARMHARGVNVRYLGHLRAVIAHPAWRVLLNSIAIARLLKNKLRAKLRAVVRSTNSSEAACRQLVAEFFNTLLFGQLIRELEWLPSQQGLSKSWQHLDIRAELERKFPGITSEKEKRMPLENWMKSTFCPRLVVCECLHMGILRLSLSATKRLFKTTDFGTMQLVEEDIEELSANVRHTHNINLYRALSAQQRAGEVLGHKSILAIGKEKIRESLVAEAENKQRTGATHDFRTTTITASASLFSPAYEPTNTNSNHHLHHHKGPQNLLPFMPVQQLLLLRAGVIKEKLQQAEAGLLPEEPDQPNDDDDDCGTPRLLSLSKQVADYNSRQQQGENAASEAETETETETEDFEAPCPYGGGAEGDDKIAKCLVSHVRSAPEVRRRRAIQRHAATLLKDASDLMSLAMRACSRDPYGALLWADILKDLASTYDDPRKIDKIYARSYENMSRSECFLGHPYKMLLMVRAEAYIQHAESYIVRKPRNLDRARELMAAAEKEMGKVSMTEHISPCFKDDHLTTLKRKESVEGPAELTEEEEEMFLGNRNLTKPAGNKKRGDKKTTSTTVSHSEDRLPEVSSYVIAH